MNLELNYDKWEGSKYMERCIQGGGRGMNKDLEVEMSYMPLEDRHGCS